MAVTASKKHPSTDIKEGELIFVATDASDALVNYQIAAIKVANITDPVAIVFDPRAEHNPNKKWFHKTSEYLKALDAAFFTTEVAEKFASKAELGALDNTTVANIFGSSAVLFTGADATALGATTVTSVTKITESSPSSSNTPTGSGTPAGSGSTNTPGTANASTSGDASKGFFASIPVWAYFLIIPVLFFAIILLVKKFFGGKKRKPIDK